MSMMKYTYAPLWVNIVYATLKWVDYKIIGRLSSNLVWWRCDLLDKYCQCPKCLERRER